MSIAKSAMRGITETLQDHASDGDGRAVAIPSSFGQHQIIVQGFSVFVAGEVQPETALNVESTEWAPIGDPIVVPDGKVALNFSGIYGAIRCPISTPMANGGECVVTYKGSP